MAKKKKGKKLPEKKESEEKRDGSWIAKKKKAVDDLLNADESNSPKVSEEELRKYTSHRKLNIPGWVGILFIKFWFAGAICYFFFWGMANYLDSWVDRLFIIGMALGIMTDVLVNNAIRFFAKTEGANDKWMMFPKKKFSSFFLNILYAYVVVFLVYTLYTAINTAAYMINPDRGTIVLGVEPILFGVFVTAADVMLTGIKNTLIKIVNDAKAKV